MYQRAETVDNKVSLKIALSNTPQPIILLLVKNRISAVFAFNKYKQKYYFHFWLLAGFCPKNLVFARKNDDFARLSPQPSRIVRL